MKGNFGIVVKLIVVDGDEESTAAVQHMIERGIALAGDALTEAGDCRNVLHASAIGEIGSLEDCPAPFSTVVDEGIVTLARAVAVFEIEENR